MSCSRCFHPEAGPEGYSLQWQVQAVVAEERRQGDLWLLGSLPLIVVAGPDVAPVQEEKESAVDFVVVETAADVFVLELETERKLCLLQAIAGWLAVMSQQAKPRRFAA